MNQPTGWAQLFSRGPTLPAPVADPPPLVPLCEIDADGVTVTITTDRAVTGDAGYELSTSALVFDSSTGTVGTYTADDVTYRNVVATLDYTPGDVASDPAATPMGAFSGFLATNGSTQIPPLAVRGSATSYAGAAATSHSITLPTAQAGDTFAALIHTTQANPTATGWSLTRVGSSNWYIGLKVRAGSDTLTLSTPGSAAAFALVLALTTDQPITPTAAVAVDASNRVATSAGTSHEAPTVTARAGDLLLSAARADGVGLTLTGPAEDTNTALSLANARVTVGYEIADATGTTPTRTFTTSASVVGDVCTVALKLT